MEAKGFRAVPLPKQLRALEGAWRPPEAVRAVVSPEARTRRAAEELAARWREAGQGTLAITVDDALPRYSLQLGAEAPEFLRPPSHPEGYAIRVSPTGAALRGRDATGLLYAVYTFARALEDSAAGIPCAAVVDWPSMPRRIVMFDLAREQHFRLDYMKSFLRRLSELKINTLMLYLEARYAFARHRFWPEGSLTPPEARDLVRYGYDLGVEVIPQVNCFGHMENLLVGDYARLRENPENAYNIDPTNPDTLPFLADLFDEMIETFPTSFYHAGFDEVWSLGNNPRTRALLERIGYAEFYARHIRDVHDLLAARGKRMMMWGDMVLQHPEVADRLPKDIVVFDWHYEEAPLEHRTPAFFIERGFETVVCPIVGTWHDFYLESTRGNIRSLVGSGHAQGAAGACGCIWELRDRRVPELHWPSIGYFAESCWREDAAAADYDARFARQFFGADSGEPSALFEMGVGVDHVPPRVTLSALMRTEWVKAPKDDHGTPLDEDVCERFGGCLESVSARQLEGCDSWAPRVARHAEVLRWYAHQAALQRVIGERLVLWHVTRRTLTHAAGCSGSLSEDTLTELRSTGGRWEALRAGMEAAAQGFREAHKVFGTAPRSFERLEANAREAADLAQSLQSIRSAEEARMALMGFLEPE